VGLLAMGAWAECNVVELTPEPQVNGVHPLDTLRVVIDAPIDPASVNASTFRVHRQRTGAAAGAIRVEVRRAISTLLFVPDNAFTADESVSVTMTAGIQSTSGEPLSPFTSTFRVASRGGATNEFSAANMRASSDFADHAALADFDRDGDLDCMRAVDQSVLRVDWNDGRGYWLDSGQRLLSPSVTRILLGDLDGDGDVDALTLNGRTGPQPSTTWLNNGAGYFYPGTQQWEPLHSRDGVLGDLDGDGDIDFAHSAWTGGLQHQYIWINDGQARFTNTWDDVYRLPNFMVHLRSLYPGDLDNDGDLDLFLVEMSGTHCLFMNDGYGAFVSQPLPMKLPLGRIIWDAVLSDLDGDHDLDLATALGQNGGSNNAETRVFRNEGTNGLVAAMEDLDFSGTANGYYAIDAGDLDGDGDIDFFACSYPSNPVCINRSYEPNIDTDRDGMPDAWEQRFGLGASASNAPSADADRDGMSDWQEFVTGTNPSDDQSFWQPLRFVEPATPNALAVAMEPTLTSRWYRVEWKADMGDADSPWVPAGENVRGTGSVLPYPVPDGVTTGFLRAVAIPPPY